MFKFIIAGNPNVGKSTLFNSITKSSEHTGNYHGVTVEEKSKIVKFNNESYQFVDLPGIYSLNCNSFEEEVSKTQLLKSNNIIMLLDANSLRKNLYLCLQLSEMNINYKILINNYDYFKKNKNEIDVNLLNKNLKNEVEIVNAKKIKLQEFLKIIKNDSVFSSNYNKKTEIFKKNEQNLNNLENNFNFDYLKKYINLVKNKFNLTDYEIIHALNGDILPNLQKKQEIFDYIQQILPDLIADRYKFIDNLLEKAIKIKSGFCYGYSKFDKILLNPIFMLIFFVFTFFASIYIIFFNIGPLFSDFLINIFNFLIATPFLNFLYSTIDNIWVIQFFEGGVFSSVTTVLSFLPQVTLLFIFLGVLEDSGLIGRLAFVLDDFLSAFGLNGKAIYIMLLGFGCNTVSTMATRSMNTKELKIKSAIINPYFSCMARLPIFVIIASAFFSKYAYFVVAGLYVLGIVVALVMSLILNKTMLPTKRNDFLLEFAPLRGVEFKRVLKLGAQNGLDMLKRIFGVVLTVGIIVWILSHTKFNLQFTEAITDSILFFFADKISFLFAPIGLNNAGIVSALIVGLMAKELIVSTISITNSVNTNSALISSLTLSSSVVHFTPASALSFLVFILLYCPCMSNMAVLKKEVGGFYFAFATLSQLTIAYLMSFVVYLACTKGAMLSILAAVIIAAIVASIIYISKKIKHPKCLSCNKCK